MLGRLDNVIDRVFDGIWEVRAYLLSGWTRQDLRVLRPFPTVLFEYESSASRRWHLPVTPKIGACIKGESNPHSYLELY